LSPYWSSYGFGRIDAKNVTIVFFAGGFNTNLRQSGLQGRRMPKLIDYSDPNRRPIAATRRTMIQIEGSRFQGSGCSECAWVFNPSGPPIGDSLADMLEKYERLRDKEFADHVCAEHPRSKNANV
jgi:hypothetical protein